MSLIPLDNFLGAALVGIIVSSVVYGITCLQVYLYYTEHSNGDGRFLKSFVAVLMALDTFHLTLLSHFIYDYTVTNFGNYLALLHDPWSLLVEIGIGGVLTSCVQFFFAYRVFRLSTDKNYCLPAAIILLSLGQLVAIFGFMITCFQVNSVEDAEKNIAWCWAGLAIDFACDVVITVSMIYYLNRNRTQFAKTNRAINMLITYSLNTGLLVTIFCVIALVLSITNKHTLLYAPFYFVLVRLYSCSFMSILNTRGVVRAALDGTQTAVTLSHLAAATPSFSDASGTRRSHGGPVPQIGVKKTSETDFYPAFDDGKAVGRDVV